MASQITAGQRVRLLHDIDRYPHFVAPAGAAGTVVDVGNETVFAVRMDDTIVGAEEWENEVHWSNDDDPTDDIEVI